MASHLSPSCSSATHGPHDISIYNPIENQPPAKRLRRLFYDPERMPTMELVFSEYDSKKGTFASSLGDAALPPFFRPQGPLSQNEMSALVEDPSYSSPSPCPPQHVQPCTPFTTSSPCSGLDEQALSQQLEHMSLTSDELPRASIYPCSPISQEDKLGSPLQDSIEAYMEADRDFRPPPLPDPVERGRKQHPQPAVSATDAPLPQSFESVGTSVSSSLFSSTSRRMARGRSSTWSSDVTTVGSSSFASVKENKGIGIILGRASAVRRHGACPAQCSPEGMGMAEGRSTLTTDDESWDTETITEATYPCGAVPRRKLAAASRGARPEARGRLSGVTRAASHIRATWAPYRSVSATTRCGIRKADISPPIEAGNDPASADLMSDDDDDDDTCPGMGSRGEDGRLTTMTASLRHRYVGLSYKVRLALFRAEKRVAKKLGRRRSIQDVGLDYVT